MARGSPRGPIADPRTGFHGGGPRQGAYPIHPGQMQQMGGQGSSNRRSRNRGGQGAQAQGAQQYKYTQNARNAANMAPSMTQLPPQAHLMPPQGKIFSTSRSPKGECFLDFQTLR